VAEILDKHPDQDGMDEWDLCIFDVNNPSETLLHSQGKLSVMMDRASRWVISHPEVHTHITFGQIR
jgi:hypothetical protein